MRIYYDELAKNIVLGQANRLFATGSLEASEFRDRVSIVYKDTEFRELFIRHDKILKEDGSRAGQTIAEVLAYLNAEFVKSPFESGPSSANGAPTFVDPDEVFTVGRKSQLLFASPIDCEGILAVDGLLIEVI